MGTRLTVSGSRSPMRGVVTRNLGRGMQRAGGALTTTTRPRPQKAPSPSPSPWGANGPRTLAHCPLPRVPAVQASTVQAAWFTNPCTMYPIRAAATWFTAIRPYGYTLAIRLYGYTLAIRLYIGYTAIHWLYGYTLAIHVPRSTMRAHRANAPGEGNDRKLRTN